MSISRRQLIATTSAGVAAAAVAGGPAVFAQDKPTIKVGSRSSTEQLIMGEIVAQLAESDGYPVERTFNLGGTLVSHEALVSGDLDTYAEYTGSGLIVVLGKEMPTADDGTESESIATPAIDGGGRAQRVYDIVSEAYLEDLQIEWLEPFGFNNAWAMAMRREHAEELGLTKVSDLAPIAGDLTIGSDAEGMVREDGVAGLEDAYDLEFGNKVSLDSGLMYTAVAEGNVDIITGFSTDGRIKMLDLVVLEDDLEFFPPYWAAPIVRTDTLEENPELRNTLNQLAGKIDSNRMAELNNLADGEGMEYSDIVRNLLVEEGIVEE